MYNKVTYNEVKTVNYFDILPQEIIDRIFIFKTLEETFIESQEQELYAKILRKEEKEIRKYIRELACIQSNIESVVMKILRITNDKAIDKANDIKIAEYLNIENILHEKVLFILQEQRLIADKLMNINESIEQLDENYSNIMEKLD